MLTFGIAFVIFFAFTSFVSEIKPGINAKISDAHTSLPVYYKDQAAALVGDSIPSVSHPLNAYTNSRFLDSTQVAEIVNSLPFNISVVTPPDETTPGSIITQIINVIGSLLTTIILWYLHRKFPDIFISKKVRDYKNKI